MVDPLGATVGILSAIVMCGVYFYNKRLAKKLKSSALIAAAKDNLSDAVTSIGTSIAIVAASFNLTIIDYITAIIITFFILKTAMISSWKQPLVCQTVSTREISRPMKKPFLRFQKSLR